VSRLRFGPAAALAVALLALAVPSAIAVFVATTSNTGNSFQSAAVFPGAVKMATGTYTGDNGDDRAIAVGFQPDLVIVKDESGREGVARSASMVGDLSKPMGTLTALQADNIQSFTATGFVVGGSNRVNQNNRDYYWVAIKGYSQSMKVGTYTGNGTGQAITGVGFAPENVVVLGNTAQRAVLHFAGGRTYRFDSGTSIASGVTSMDADGFTVGTALETNTATVAYHYIAFNDVANSVDASSYAGDGADNRSVATPGFQPEYALIRADDNVTGRPAVHRPASLAGDNTLLFAGSASVTNRIQALQAGGFQVGNSGDVNAAGVTYYSLALRSSAP
jgi:uncharacterized protein with FMN-binding domain